MKSNPNTSKEIKNKRQSNVLQFLVIVGLTVFAAVFFAIWSIRSKDDEMRAGLIKDAQLVGNSIDWRNLQKLTATENDVFLPAYQRLKEQLSLVRAASPLCSFIYIMGQNADGTVYFFLDSEPQESKDYSPPGQLYPDASTALKSVFILKKPVTEGPLPDEWGVWISSFVPLIDQQTGENIGILGMDVDAKNWNLQIMQSLTIPISITLILLILEAIYFFIRIRNERETSRLAESRELLKQSEARYRQLVEHAPAGIYEVDLTKNLFISVNDVMCNYVGYSKEEMLNFGPTRILTQESQKNYLERLEKIRMGAEVSLIVEHKAITRQGKEFWILVNTQYFFEEGRLVRATGVIHDITERKLAEQALIKAKEAAERSDRLKDAFISNISHEIRTPLNSILGFADLLPDMISEENKESAEHIFEIINLSGKRLTRTVEMIMNFSRLQIGEFPVNPDNISLPTVLQSVVNEFNVLANEKSLTLLFENQCGEVKLFIDEYCVIQAIYNLLDNAIKFTPEGYVKLVLYKNEEDIIIDVEDSGIGISEDYLIRLFEPFSQEDTGLSRNYEGIGLGLSTVKKLLDLVGAEITVDSVKGHGTVFHIRFGSEK